MTLLRTLLLIFVFLLGEIAPPRAILPIATHFSVA